MAVANYNGLHSNPHTFSTYNLRIASHRSTQMRGLMHPIIFAFNVRDLQPVENYGIKVVAPKQMLEILRGVK